MKLKEWVITGDLTVPSCKGTDNAYLVVDLPRGQDFFLLRLWYTNFERLQNISHSIVIIVIIQKSLNNINIKTVNEIENNNSIWFTTYLFHNYHQCIQLHIHTCSYLHHLCNFLHSRMDHFHSHQYLYVWIFAIKLYFNIFLFCNQASIFFWNGI